MTAVTAKAAAQDTTGWIAEWSVNPQHCTEPCAAALTSFSLDVVGIVVGYLRKNNIYGLEAQLNAYADRPRSKTLPEYIPQARAMFVHNLVGGGMWTPKLAEGQRVDDAPIPDEVEALMQTDLNKLFSEKARACWPGMKKVTEVYSIYYKPPKMSAGVVGCIGSFHYEGEAIHVDQTERQIRLDFKDTTDKSASYILFPDMPTGCESAAPKTTADALKLVPKGWKIASYPDSLFCMFTKYVCTGVRIGEKTYICTSDQSGGKCVQIGKNDGTGIRHIKTGKKEIYAVAPAFKIFVQTAPAKA